jgi:hypothetical protein
LLDQVYVPRSDSATHIYIVVEVGVRNRLEALRLTEVGVATGNNSTCVYVTQKRWSSLVSALLRRLPWVLARSKASLIASSD